MTFESNSPFTPAARKAWEEIDPQARVRILNNVFCVACGGNCSMELQTARIKRGDLVLNGRCIECGEPVARLIEGG